MSRVDEFVGLLLDRLMPPGRLLTRDPDSNLGRLLKAPAMELERLESLAEFVVQDLPPRNTQLFLTDWERALGLPDCDVLPPTTIERQALVLEKFTRPANLTLANLEAICLTAGYDVTITETGTPHQFDVAIAAVPVTPFRTGVSRAGDRLGSFGLEPLQCLLDAVKPHHTTYTLTSP